MAELKWCRKCDHVKQVSEFPIRNAATGKLHSYCLTCQSAMSREHYQANKGDYKRKVQNTTHRNRRLISKAKSKPCADCGVSYPPYVMDFDHRDGHVKIQSLGNMTRASKARILAEIAKCDVVCANCHRERTHRRMIAGTAKGAGASKPSPNVRRSRAMKQFYESDRGQEVAAASSQRLRDNRLWERAAQKRQLEASTQAERITQ